jgi:hypothetical protein
VEFLRKSQINEYFAKIRASTDTLAGSPERLIASAGAPPMVSGRLSFAEALLQRLGQRSAEVLSLSTCSGPT